MSFKEINAWVVMLVFGWLFIDYGWPLLQARSLEGGTADRMITSVVFFVIVLVVAHIIVGVIRRKPAEEEDERDRLIEVRAERFGGLVLGGVVVFALIFALRAEEFVYANILFLGLVFSEIAKRLWQVALYRRGA